MSQPIWEQGGHKVFPIDPKNTNLVEDLKILLPVKFLWIPLSSFREVKNVSSNQRPGRPSCFYVSAIHRPGRPSCFSDWPEKHKLGRGRRHLACCQVSFNFFQWFQSRFRKCLAQSETRVAILFVRSTRKTHLVEDVKTLLPVMFRWIPCCGFREEVVNVSANQKARVAILFFRSAQKTQT